MSTSNFRPHSFFLGGSALLDTNSSHELLPLRMFFSATCLKLECVHIREYFSLFSFEYDYSIIWIRVKIYTIVEMFYIQPYERFIL